MPSTYQASTCLEASTHLEASTCLGVYGGSINLPGGQPHGQAAQTTPSAQTATARSGRANNAKHPKRDRPVRPRKHRSSTQSATTRSGRASNAMHPKRDAQVVGCKTNLWENHPDTLPTPKSHNGNPPSNKLFMPGRTTQIWGCLCLPTDVDLSMPPHRYGPVYASPQIWACLCLPTDIGLCVPPHDKANF